MKNDLKKLKSRGGWFDIETVGTYTGGIGQKTFAPGFQGFARRNNKQTNIIQIIAPIITSPEQIAAFYIPEDEARFLIKLIGRAKSDDEANLHWANIWNCLGTLQTYDLKSLKLDA